MRISWVVKYAVGLYIAGIVYSTIFGLIVGVSWSLIFSTYYEAVPIGLTVGGFSGWALAKFQKQRTEVKMAKPERT